MAVTVVTETKKGRTFEVTGLTSGNGYIYRIPDSAEDIVVEYIPTSAGTASVKFSINPSDPTDFTNMAKTNIGDVTATGGQEIQAGVRWIGLDPASGTWTFRFAYNLK